VVLLKLGDLVHKSAMLAVLAGLSVALVAPLAAEGARVSIPFRYGWRFHYGPGPDDGASACVCQ
jgi:hypothetical protein